MQIVKAEFVKSSSHISQCPIDDRPEVAFIGRSNVGKSSLINMLTSKKGLAKTSSTPGKTQTINHFDIDGKWYLVDLPGYGYARVSKSERSRFHGFITEYITKRETIYTLGVLIDSRLAPQQIDLDFIEFLGENKVPFFLVLTKTDKLKPAELKLNVENYKNKLLETWEELPPLFITSAVEKDGRDEVLGYLDSFLK